MTLLRDDLNQKRNIGLLALIYIPLVVLAKLIRWTIMKPQLVDMSVGWTMVGIINSGSEESFRGADNVMALFKGINFCGLTTFVEWEWFITIVWNVIIFIFVYNLFRNNKRIGMLDNIFIYLNIAILNIFCFNMSKEPGQMLYFVLMAMAITLFKNKSVKVIMTYTAILVTTLFMRRYFAIVFIYFGIVKYIIEWWFSKMDDNSQMSLKQNIMAVLGACVIFSLCQYVLLTVMSIADPATYLEMIRVNNREGADAVSEIAPIFKSENRALFTVDYFIKIFRLMLPVELILKAKVTYLFIIAYHSMLFGYICKLFMNFKKISDIQKIALYLYIAFWLCSASFEPDFGSWIRHEGVAFPVIILMLYSNKQNVESEKPNKSSLLC